MISADEINELAIKIAEISKRGPTVPPPPETIAEFNAINKGLDELFQPLAEKYGLDVGSVIEFRETAVDWVNMVIDGRGPDYTGVFYDRMMETIHCIVQDEDTFDDVDVDPESVAAIAKEAAAIAKANLNGLFYDILMMMMAEDRDYPVTKTTDTKPVTN